MNGHDLLLTIIELLRLQDTSDMYSIICYVCQKRNINSMRREMPWLKIGATY